MRHGAGVVVGAVVAFTVVGCGAGTSGPTEQSTSGLASHTPAASATVSEPPTVEVDEAYRLNHRIVDWRYGPDRGYGTQGIDTETDTIDLWWKGPIPADLQAVLDAAGPGVTVRVHAAKYSSIEALAGVKRLMQSKDPRLATMNVTIPTAGEFAGMSGIDVRYLRADDTRPWPTDKPALLALMSEIARVDVVNAEPANPEMLKD